MALKITRSNLAEHLLEYQLSLINKTVKDAIEVGDWKNHWGYTQVHAEAFRRYAIPLIKKTLKCNRKKSEGVFDWFRINYGLKVYNT